MTTQAGRVRLDKWLWAARFFKTRQLAAEAINGGKVHLNGLRSKPGREVKVGSQLRIHKGPYEWEIQVRVVANRRRPAVEAREFYQETEASQRRRQELSERLRAERAAQPRPAHHRLNKRDRRLIHRFTSGSE